MADIDPRRLAQAVAHEALWELRVRDLEFTQGTYAEGTTEQVAVRVIDQNDIDTCHMEYIVTDLARVWRVEVTSEGEAEEVTGEEAREYLAKFGPVEGH